MTVLPRAVSGPTSSSARLVLPAASTPSTATRTGWPAGAWRSGPPGAPAAPARVGEGRLVGFTATASPTRWLELPTVPHRARGRLDQDVVGVPDPCNRLAALVPAITEVADRRDQVGNAREAAPPDRLAGEDRKGVVFAIEERLATVLEIAERQLRSDEEP
jgi:hypothetical protein